MGVNRLVFFFINFKSINLPKHNNEPKNSLYRKAKILFWNGFFLGAFCPYIGEFPPFKPVM
jgi:hypothetical protein